MKQIKSQVEFVKRLYLFKGTVNSIAERAEFWAKEDEESIPFGHRLKRSPLAQRVVRDLVYWSWDAARMLEDYVVDGQQSTILLLQDLGARSLEKPSGEGHLDGYASHFHTLDLNTLELAARTLSEIIDDIFQDLFLKLPWPQIESSLDGIIQDLRLIDTKLDEMFYWLGEILDDLGNVMPPGEMSLEDKPAQTRQAG